MKNAVPTKGRTDAYTRTLVHIGFTAIALPPGETTTLIMHFRTKLCYTDNNLLINALPQGDANRDARNLDFD